MAKQPFQSLEQILWQSADQLRANSKLTAAEYTLPILGLIFLRHASNRFEAAEAEIRANLPSRGGKTREVTRDDFKAKGVIYLEPSARYDHILERCADGPAEVIRGAIAAIEEARPDLKGVLPTEYDRLDPGLLVELLKIFNHDLLRTASGDVFGKIYEFFLNKFALAGAQEGGEFFTPPSLVNLIVHTIEPTQGRIFDPACGSGGMFVHAAEYVRALGGAPLDNSYVGREKATLNANLARMNLAVHGLDGNIQIGNTFYNHWAEHVGKCDFVMANPPFNVDGVDNTKFGKDDRLWTGKKIPGISSGGKGKPKGVTNANYLWIQYFHAYLKPTSGRAGFVMASSATDAGHGEQEIRKEIIQTGDVDAIISIGTNFFYTRTLPCTLWFFDRGKPAARRDHILMIDAREVYRVVTRKLRDFSDAQLLNLSAITWLYRGQTSRFLRLVESWLAWTTQDLRALPEPLDALAEATSPLDLICTAFRDALRMDVLNEKSGGGQKPRSEAAQAFRDEHNITDEALTAWDELRHERREAWTRLRKDQRDLIQGLTAWAGALPQGLRESQTPARTIGHLRAAALLDNDAQRQHGDALKPWLDDARALIKQLQHTARLEHRVLEYAERNLAARKHDDWKSREISANRRTFDEARDGALHALKTLLHTAEQIDWLQSRFPDATFAPVPGLCAVVTRQQVEDADWSLTPGRYVGVGAPQRHDEDDVDFAERMQAIHDELKELHEEGMELMTTILANFEEVVG